MFKKEEMINPEKTMIAHLARLTDEDLEINKLDNVSLRCTNEAYIVGELKETKEGLPIFLDIMDENSFGYLYFQTVSEAEYALKPFASNELFVIYAKPLTDLGIYRPLYKEHLRQILADCGLIFNFMDEEEVKQKVKVPRIDIF